MAVEHITLDPNSPDKALIARAAKALAEGALVAFPTETVYGLAANAADSNSVERLREVKGRVERQPFTVHIGRRSDCEDFVLDMSLVARRLMRKSWPGPLTLIFPVADARQAKAHGGLCEAGVRSIYSENSVGIRFPDHVVAEELLKAAGAPIIASSANATGMPPPFEAPPIREQLGDRIDLLLDAGPTRHRKNSTIVALNGQGYRIVRTGVLDERMVRRLATVTILFVCTGNTCRSPMAEGFCRKMLAERLSCRPEELLERGIIIQSAGTLGISGARASLEAVEVCRHEGIDISSHVSQGLAVELIHPADYIFTMAGHHLDVIRSLSPRDAEKAGRLHPDEDIADPIGGTPEDYRLAAEKIKQALERRINEVVL